MQATKQPQVTALIDETGRDVILRSYLASLFAPPADYPSDAEFQAAYDRNPTLFTQPHAVRLSQIYIAVPAGADAATVAKRGEWRRYGFRAMSGRPVWVRFCFDATVRDVGDLWRHRGHAGTVLQDVAQRTARDAVSDVEAVDSLPNGAPRHLLPRDPAALDETGRCEGVPALRGVRPSAG